MRKGEIMGKIFGIALAILVILALALVRGAPPEVAVAPPTLEACAAERCACGNSNEEAQSANSLRRGTTLSKTDDGSAKDPRSSNGICG